MLLDTNWDRDNPYVIEINVNNSHVDGYGHVSTHNYVQWMIECAFRHSADKGVPESMCRKLGRGMAVHDFDVQLAGSAYAGDTLKVANWISKNDSKLRVSRHFQIINAQSLVTLTRGDFNFVCIYLDSGRPAKMPIEFSYAYSVESEPTD